MGRLDPETRKGLLDRFLRDCEIAESVVRPSGCRELQKVEGCQAKRAVTSLKADNSSSQMKPKANNKEAEAQNAQAASPEADEGPEQESSSNMNQGHPADPKPADEQEIIARKPSKEINLQSQALPRGDSPLTSESETQSPRTTRAQKTSEVNRVDKINELSRGTRKTRRATSQSYDHVRTPLCPAAIIRLLTGF
ncbi:hypothetical protein DFH28DRAFT_885545 [Melampsora americana]|nr:hypothetical protein DFH28DRAFT_911713 [Melampsora americana]KAH9820021.1 hypothetical protein DFH28DRAFT_885545 [Melampsora americana]